MPLERRKLKKALITAGLAPASMIVSHVNGSLTVMARVRPRQGAEVEVTRLARKVKTLFEQQEIPFDVVKAGHSPKARVVFITVTNDAMVAQAGRGAHPGVVVVPAQADRTVYEQLFGTEGGVVLDLTEQVANLPALTAEEQEELATLEASER